MKKKVRLFVIGFLTLCLFAFTIPVSANGITWYVPDDFVTIQGAVNGATAGDTIIVRNGVYTENVDVNKQLTIQSQNGYLNTTVVALDADDHVFDVIVDSVTIDGFSIYGATGTAQAGIALSGCSVCTIQNNRCGWDYAHKNCCGIHLSSSSNNIIINNIASNNLDGILLASSSHNTISKNTCNSNSSYGGIFLGASDYNTIVNNICNSNSYGISLDSWIDYNTISDNIYNSNNGHGIYQYTTRSNTISENICNSNYYGIYLYYLCNTNTFTKNTVSNNYCGISLYYSGNNPIYLNNFSNNTTNVYSEDSNNTWNSPTTIYYDYITGSFKGYLGNYYSDYSGTDSNGDGIGDTLYTGTGMSDTYPLMTISDNYSLQAWYPSSDNIMYRDDMTKPSGSVSINGGGSNIWIADQPAPMDFPGTDTWTGQLTFTSAPASGHSFTVEMGFTADGTDFTPGGPETIIIGNGIDWVFAGNFDTPSSFIVPAGNYLALRITNNSDTGYNVQTGGAWSYCSSPEGSYGINENGQEYILQTRLLGCYPNPVCAGSPLHFRFTLGGLGGTSRHVELNVYNLRGELVDVVLNGEMEVTDDEHVVVWTLPNLPNGVYFCQLKTKSVHEVRKFVVVR